MKTRITTLQKTILNNHIKAFENKSFSDAKRFNNIAELKEHFSNGGTSKILWDKIIDHNVSITSQIMMTTNHISTNAKKAITEGFKGFLNNANII